MSDREEPNVEDLLKQNRLVVTDTKCPSASSLRPWKEHGECTGTQAGVCDGRKIASSGYKAELMHSFFRNQIRDI